jgi:hypothetical protein
VRERDPNWRPTPFLAHDAEGHIRGVEGEAREAQARFFELQRAGIGPGRFAGESIRARGPERDFTIQENQELNRIGQDTGCHTCGTREPGTNGATSWLTISRRPRTTRLAALSAFFRIAQVAVPFRVAGFGITGQSRDEERSIQIPERRPLCLGRYRRVGTVPEMGGARSIDALMYLGCFARLIPKERPMSS